METGDEYLPAHQDTSLDAANAKLCWFIYSTNTRQGPLTLLCWVLNDPKVSKCKVGPCFRSVTSLMGKMLNKTARKNVIQICVFTGGEGACAGLLADAGWGRVPSELSSCIQKYWPDGHCVCSTMRHTTSSGKASPCPSNCSQLGRGSSRRVPYRKAPPNFVA